MEEKEKKKKGAKKHLTYKILENINTRMNWKRLVCFNIKNDR